MNSDEKILTLLGEMRTDLHDIKDRLSSVEATQSAMQADLSEVKTELGEVKSRVSNIETELGEVKTELGEVKNRVSNIETDLSEVKTDLSEVKTDLSEVKNRIIFIENDHGKRLGAVLDGYSHLKNEHKLLAKAADVAAVDEKCEIIMQVVHEHSTRLTAIESAVARHEKVLPRKASSGQA